MSAPTALVLHAELPVPDHTRLLAALFDAHEQRLYTLARRLTANPDEARDLVQDTFLRAAQSLASVPADELKARAWLIRVLVNIRRDHWRKRAVRQRAAPLLQPDAPGPHQSNAESALIAKRAVRDALDALPPRRRAIVVFAEIDGLTPAEIATILGLAVMTVRWHLSMARRELKRLLALQM